MRQTQVLRDLWGPPCGSDMTTISLWTGARITVRNTAVAAFQALDTTLKAWSYAPRKGVTGAYNCRKITGGSGYSLHAYGIAADLNWDRNPYGPRLVTDMPRGMVEAILAIRTGGGDDVFGWGGFYKKNKDAMHFELVASPPELASGIRGSGAGRPATGDPGGTGFPGVLTEGAEGEAVRAMQVRLNLHLRAGGQPEIPLGPARFGPKTKAAVVWFQGARGLVPDGVVGEATWTALSQPAPQPAGAVPAFPGELTDGATGERVREMQARLNLHLRAGGQPEIPLGPARFGPKTTAAVIWFQISQGLTADGVVGPATWEALWR